MCSEVMTKTLVRNIVVGLVDDDDAAVVAADVDIAAVAAAVEPGRQRPAGTEIASRRTSWWSSPCSGRSSVD